MLRELGFTKEAFSMQERTVTKAKPYGEISTRTRASSSGSSVSRALSHHSGGFAGTHVTSAGDSTAMFRNTAGKKTTFTKKNSGGGWKRNDKPVSQMKGTESFKNVKNFISTGKVK